MLKRTRENFEFIKRKLLRQKAQVESELKELEKKDPVMADGLAESSEPGTESWMADVHNQVVAVKQTLQGLLEKTKTSLFRLRTGKYGKCENCGNKIEAERLEAMPAATLCLSCSKKSK